ncbi:MAG: peptidoglycan bridge formation glycyltransferase FemA/FemB family protein [Candidatus Staskawiczbacteria bacterium]|nr:peptidoglycan bridge formation glycyltransferase FemA/FemB family protein [Candidatus Staskawiczbacteria bacterium]MBI3337470.1 peptidoglycan bridge formation glycyltransferase FemA/FemB family protein [Candidatus Staskawiczbacteria bacterium]
MEIIEIGNPPAGAKKVWEDFLLGCKEKTFLQSWNWGEFHILLGNKIWRFGIFDDDKIIAVALIIKISAKRGSFLLVPHGPVIKSEIYEIKLEILKILKNKLENLAKIEKADFIRISPILKRTDENNKLFKNLGFRIGPLHYHPESSWKLEINLNESQILSQMRKTTRYLISHGQNNKDIEIIRSTNVKDMKIFYKMHQEVVKAQNFIPFSLDYLSKEFLAFLSDNQILLFFAKYKGNIIAGSFEIFWSGIGFYHHAALLPEFKKLPVSYLLQWEAIKEAKARNFKIYDFWGYADPIKNPKHPYSGPTLFKMGFGGQMYEYVKTQDFIISPKYWLNYIIEIFRKFKRGL